jgi:hypothetical protein
MFDSPIHCTVNQAASVEVTGTDICYANLFGYTDYRFPDLRTAVQPDCNGRGVKGLINTAFCETSGALVYNPDKLLMDGTASIRDLITDTAFTMTGTPAVATLLGATAPEFSPIKYTGCSIATPFSAGQAITIFVVCKTTWAGNDINWYNFFANTSGGQATANAITLLKNHVPQLVLTVTDSAGNSKIKYGNLNAINWAAGTNHFIIAEIAADNTQQLILDGVALTLTSGTSGREAALETTTKLATPLPGVENFNGVALWAMWGRVLTADEKTALSGLAAWSTLTTRTVTATKAAVASARHVVTGIIASSDKAGAVATVYDGTDVKATFVL